LETATETTGFVPAIYDKGTHYVTNMRLTLDILKRLDDFDFVEEVAGDYTGTLIGRGASHEHGKYRVMSFPENEKSSYSLLKVGESKCVNCLNVDIHL
jgi:hypothetical protein